jgi:alanine racemase
MLSLARIRTAPFSTIQCASFLYEYARNLTPSSQRIRKYVGIDKGVEMSRLGVSVSNYNKFAAAPLWGKPRHFHWPASHMVDSDKLRNRLRRRTNHNQTRTFSLESGQNPRNLN